MVVVHSFFITPINYAEKADGARGVIDDLMYLRKKGGGSELCARLVCREDVLFSVSCHRPITAETTDGKVI